MKTMRKLVPAIAMLLVSLVVMSSASFAWFSMNRTVTATGMDVTATVPAQLLIKGSASTAIYKSAIDFTAAADSANYDKVALSDLLPVAYKKRSDAIANPNDTFKKLVSGSYNKVDDNGQVSGAEADLSASDYEAAVAGTDYVKDTFTLKYAGTLDTNLDNCKLTITLTKADSNESAIKNAIHVILVDNLSNVYEIDMGSATGAAPTYTVEQNVTTFTADNQEITYTVYIFFDGEDADCKNSNAVNMSGYSFDFKFDLVA